MRAQRYFLSVNVPSEADSRAEADATGALLFFAEGKPPRGVERSDNSCELMKDEADSRAEPAAPNA